MTEENKSAAEAMQEKILEALETVIDPELGIDIVYPAWSPDRMSRYARIALGIR